ncbi:MAG: DUF4920 domain-containing protein [Bacteroidota bacterium]|nr:DUF4920 domain-containing protein [Bacteroidota bacterium]
MKKIITACLIMLVIACNVFAGSVKKLGKELTLKNKTKISEILKKPDSFVGKKVLIEGMVVDVCSKRGCWMEIASDKSFQKIKVKVNDGEIVFPMEAKGKTAKVEGTVYQIKMTKEQVIEKKTEEAKEKGKTFDPNSVKGPETIYQIKGLGAEIK